MKRINERCIHVRPVPSYKVGTFHEDAEKSQFVRREGALYRLDRRRVRCTILKGKLESARLSLINIHV